jgi:hypothetical protein
MAMLEDMDAVADHRKLAQLLEPRLPADRVLGLVTPVVGQGAPSPKECE